MSHARPTTCCVSQIAQLVWDCLYLKCYQAQGLLSLPLQLCQHSTLIRHWHRSCSRGHWHPTANGQIRSQAIPCWTCGGQTGNVVGPCPCSSFLCCQCHPTMARHPEIHLLPTLKISAPDSFIYWPLLMFCPVCAMTAHEANQWLYSVTNN